MEGVVVHREHRAIVVLEQIAVEDRLVEREIAFVRLDLRLTDSFVAALNRAAFANLETAVHLPQRQARFRFVANIGEAVGGTTVRAVEAGEADLDDIEVRVV